jgi:hypothetical protein
MRAVLLKVFGVSLAGKGCGARHESSARRSPGVCGGAMVHHHPLAHERSVAMEDDGAGTILALGVIFLAGMMLIMGGIFQAIEGFIALVQDNFYAVPRSYPFSTDATVWGWTHIIFGTLMTAAGIYLFVGKLWARLIGIAVAILSAISNFLFIPYYPIWSILILVLDVLVIWALVFRARAAAELVGLDE